MISLCEQGYSKTFKKKCIRNTSICRYSMTEAALHCCSETTTFILQRLSKTPNEPGWASSLTASCKGERSTQGGRSTQKSPLCQQSYAIGREMWTFPKAAADKVCSGRRWRGLLWLPGSMDKVLGDLQDHVLSGKYGPVARAGNLIHTHFFPYSPSVSESRFISRAPLQQGKSIPFLLQLGNVGTSILLTFPRLQSQTGAAGCWSGLLIRALITPSNPPSSSKATTSAV